MNNLISRKIQSLFSHKCIRLFALLLAFVVSLPALDSGMMMDDYLQRSVVLSDSDTNPYEFYRMGSERTHESIEYGILPWWLHPESRLAFYRPVANWLMELDYQLWPESLPLMHFHSILWYLILVFIAGAVYQRMMPSALAAGLALIMFVLDFGHGNAVAWLCNRNVMLAMILSMAALLCYRRQEWKWQIPGSLCFAVSLACAEAAIAITGYFFAYEVFLSRQPWGRRVQRLLFYAAISVAWLLFWRDQGYGAAGPGFYIDPVADPAGFLSSLVYRAPAYIVGEFISFPLEILGLMQHSEWALHTWIVIICLGAVFARLLWPVLKASPPARFFAVGMAIAALPISGAELVSRSLWYVGFGAVGLIALFLDDYFSRRDTVTPSGSIFAVALLIIHLIVSPFFFWIGIQSIGFWDHHLDSRTIRLPNHKEQPNSVLLLSTHMWEVGVSFPMIKDVALSMGSDASRPPPSIDRLRLLTTGVGEFELYRPDEDTLVVRSEEGFEWMRKGVWGFKKGESVTLSDVDITVLDVGPEGAAREIQFRFDPGVLKTYEVLEWGGDYYQPSSLPAVGDVRRVVTSPPTFE